jgi:hypothetical protein
MAHKKATTYNNNIQTPEPIRTTVSQTLLCRLTKRKKKRKKERKSETTQTTIDRRGKE